MESTSDTTGQVPPVPIDRDPEASLAGLRILIVEDMGVIVLGLRRMLDEMRCQTVGVASRLSEAKELAQTTERLDGALLDLSLFGQNSYPVAEILHGRGIPFIIMSGFDPSYIRADLVSNAHLQKPFSHDELARMMRCTFLPGHTVRKDDAQRK